MFPGPRLEFLSETIVLSGSKFKQPESSVEQICYFLAQHVTSVDDAIAALTTLYEAHYSGPLMEYLVHTVSETIRNGTYYKLAPSFTNTNINTNVKQGLDVSLRPLFMRANCPDFVLDLGLLNQEFNGIHLTEREWDLYRAAGFSPEELNTLYKFQFRHIDAAALATVTCEAEIDHIIQRNDPLYVILANNGGFENKICVRDGLFYCYVMGLIPSGKYGNSEDQIGPIAIFDVVNLEVSFADHEIDVDGSRVRYFSPSDERYDLDLDFYNKGIRTFVAKLTSYSLIRVGTRGSPIICKRLHVYACDIEVGGRIRRFNASHLKPD